MSLKLAENPKRIFRVAGIVVIGVTALIAAFTYLNVIAIWGLVAGLLVWFYGVFVYNDITKVVASDEKRG